MQYPAGEGLLKKVQRGLNDGSVQVSFNSTQRFHHFSLGRPSSALCHFFYDRRVSPLRSNKVTRRKYRGSTLEGPDLFPKLSHLIPEAGEELFSPLWEDLFGLLMTVQRN
ncbi:Hypothetical protein NTJ_11811 [Nesidiocoris tenuis]|uniref:Uncharacterized protein n=1 Tax=Nesidiocoris tenuis TaxID=355587 RepID=A0ABN7B3L6_9HEMI|nr:Hypothetical protein NTJ_11811 [Nesidiocoris tenuis]